jgi:hypothetical protein
MARGEITGKKPDSRMPKLAMSIPEFCSSHGISHGFYYKLKKQGLSPREMKAGRRTLISFESAADWRTAREAAAVTGAKPKVKVDVKAEAIAPPTPAPNPKPAKKPGRLAANAYA